MKSSFGNYVVQKALKVAINENKSKLVNTILNHVEKLGERKLIIKWKKIVDDSMGKIFAPKEFLVNSNNFTISPNNSSGSINSCNPHNNINLNNNMNNDTYNLNMNLNYNTNNNIYNKNMRNNNNIRKYSRPLITFNNLDCQQNFINNCHIQYDC